jgi:hypothetical protein
MKVGDVVWRIIKMWDVAEQMPEMRGVRFDIAKEILSKTFTVDEMEMAELPGARPILIDKAAAEGSAGQRCACGGSFIECTDTSLRGKHLKCVTCGAMGPTEEGK